MSWTHGRPAGQSIPTALRARVYRAFGRRCVRCGSTDQVQVDHITPWAEGGRTEFENLQPLCSDCHKVKSQAESARGVKRRQAKGKRPQEPHPSQGAEAS